MALVFCVFSLFYQFVTFLMPLYFSAGCYFTFLHYLEFSEFLYLFFWEIQIPILIPCEIDLEGVLITLYRVIHVLASSKSWATILHIAIYATIVIILNGISDCFEWNLLFFWLESVNVLTEIYEYLWMFWLEYVKSVLFLTGIYGSNRNLWNLGCILIVGNFWGFFLGIFVS